MRLEISNEPTLKTRFFLVNIIGILTCLKKNVVTMDEVEDFMFGPYVLDMLAYGGVSKDALGIIQEGLVLEDIKRLIPDKFCTEIDGFINRVEAMLDDGKENAEKERWFEIVLDKDDKPNRDIEDLKDYIMETVESEDEEFEEFSGHKNTDE